MTATTSERITFPGAAGEALAARLDRPLTEPSGYALFAHCFTCSKDVFAVSRISAALAERGIAVLRFDFTGLGSSEGDFANTTFSSNIGDLAAAADYLRRHHRAPSLLIGHSLGGAAVLAATPRMPEAKAVVTIGAPCDPAHVLALIRDGGDEIERRGRAEVMLAGRSFTITRQFVDNISEQRLLGIVHDMRKALLIFHAPRDAVVGIDNASRLFQAALHPKSFVSLDDADHLLSRHQDAVYVAEVVAAWAMRYLGGPTPLAEFAGGPTPAGTVVVAETGEGRFAQTLTAGRHILRADEPLAYGGNDTGPSPYDYLTAALGACTAMTIRMYAERKGIPLARVAVRLRHSKIHAQDCADCVTRDGKIDEIAREVELIGALDDATRARLLEIADKCPVHRTLRGEVMVRTTLTGPGGKAEES